MKRIVPLLIALAIGITSCSTLDRARDLNPFGESREEKRKREQGATPDEERRVSVLLFEQTLTPDAEVQGTQVTLPASYQNSDWSQLGAYPSHAPQHLQASNNMQVSWKKRIGKKSDSKGRVMAAPVISGNYLLTMDSRGDVRAFALDTKSVAWKKNFTAIKKTAAKEDKPGFFAGGFRGVGDKMRRNRSEGYGGGIAVSGGRVYVASGFGYVTALDINTGQEIWITETSTPLHTAPTIADGRLFVVSQDDELLAFDAGSGELIWTFQGIVEPARILSASAPAVYGEIVVAPFASGELGAFRVQNGRSIWTDALTRQAGLTALTELNDVAASPTVFDNTVYAISHSGLLAAVDLRTGERLWSRQVGGIHMPWIAGNTLFVLTNEAQVAAISRTDGKVVWVTEMQQFKNMKKRKKRIAWAGPVLASNRLTLVSSRGDLVQLSPQTGHVTAERKIKDTFFVPPVIANGTMYLISDKAKLYALQ